MKILLVKRKYDQFRSGSELCIALFYLFLGTNDRALCISRCKRNRTGFTLIHLPNRPQATDTQRCVLVWPATHKRTGGGPLSDEELRLALTAPSAQASGIPALGICFDGVQIAFTNAALRFDGKASQGTSAIPPHNPICKACLATHTRLKNASQT